MLNNIFLKTIYEKRWMTLFWSVGVAAMSLLMMSFYDSFSQGGFDEALNSLPDQFKSLVGDLNSLKTVPGYVSQQVFALRIPLLTIIMSVILFSSLLAGNEEERTLQSLLVQPVTRANVYFSKLVAGLAVSFVISLGSVVGVLIGLALIGEQMSMLRLFQAVVGSWIIASVFGVAAYSIGAITGKRGLAGSLAGMIAFVCYLLTSFAPSVDIIESVEKFSPFHFYNVPSIAEYGLDGSNNFVLIAIMVVFVAVSFWTFNKRDIQ
jgi:ABC-2 type transport system permease protein